MLEKAQITALIEKHRHHTPDQPDEVITKSKANKSHSDEQEGKKKVPPPYKKASNESHIKSSKAKGAKATEKEPEPLLGDDTPERKKPKKQAKSKGHSNTINETNIQIYEFLFRGSPNPPNLEGVEEEDY